MLEWLYTGRVTVSTDSADDLRILLERASMKEEAKELEAAFVKAASLGKHGHIWSLLDNWSQLTNPTALTLSIFATQNIFQCTKLQCPVILPLTSLVTIGHIWSPLTHLCVPFFFFFSLFSSLLLSY